MVIAATDAAPRPHRGFVFYSEVPPISLELTSVCNLKCPYCANNTLTRPSGYIDDALLDKLIGECAGGRHAIDWLHGTGEPLLWDRLEEVVSRIVRCGAGKGSFATNATLLYPDRVESLLEAGLRNIYISLDSMDERIYKATRGGDLGKVIRNVQTMIAIVPADFEITIALMNHKLQTITDADRARFHQTFGPPERVKLNLVGTGWMPGAREDWRAIPYKSDTCTIPSDFFFITHDGRVALCCSDQDAAHTIGDANRETIDEIWFKEENQIRFRNIALGLRPCPELCTKSCHLKEPARPAPALAASWEY
jgi:sulfatase maturation enzyme AslB (radical SAM superfamily)